MFYFTNSYEIYMKFLLLSLVGIDEIGSHQFEAFYHCIDKRFVDDLENLIYPASR